MRAPIAAGVADPVEMDQVVRLLVPKPALLKHTLEQRLLGFQRRYQQTAAPFDWRYTRADLDRLLKRLDDHEHVGTAA
jgi:hypothetical protein